MLALFFGAFLTLILALAVVFATILAVKLAAAFAIFVPESFDHLRPNVRDKLVRHLEYLISLESERI